jgi:hypothetical protein
MNVLANLNIALIDIATGADSKIIFQHLDMVQSHLKSLYGYHGRVSCLTADLATSQLCLRDGALKTANAMFQKCFSSSLAILLELVLLCAERLGDLSILVEYEEKLQHLSELCVPDSTLKEKYVEEEEMEEDTLAYTSDFGDKGRKAVLV